MNLEYQYAFDQSLCKMHGLRMTETLDDYVKRWQRMIKRSAAAKLGWQRRRAK